jgi:hypothetical protein
VSKQEILIIVAIVRGSPLIEIKVPIEEVRRIYKEEGPFQADLLQRLLESLP